MVAVTVKNPKNSDTRKFAVVTLKFEQDGFVKEKCTQAERFAKSVGPDQTAPLGAV